MLVLSLIIIIVYGSLQNQSYNEIKSINRLGLIILIYTLILNLSINKIEYITIGINLYNNLLLINNLNNTMINIILLISIIYILLISFNITGIKLIDKLNYSKIALLELILFNIIGLTLLPLVNDIMLLYMIIELQSYSLYLITSVFNESHNSLKSGLYYFIVGSIASFIILDSTVSIYDDIGLTNIQYILMYIDKIDNYNLLCLLLGLFIKIGLAPFYIYTITIYTLSPTIITNYISLMPKLSILTLIYIILYYISIINNIDIINIISFLIIISMIIGSLGGLNVIKIKTLLAYSSLLNVSYMLIAILGNNNESIIAYIYYIFQYSLTHLDIFSIILLMSIYSPINTNIINNSNKLYNDNKLLISKYSPIEYLSQFKNLFINNIYLAISLIICLFSLIGIPPLSGFYGKLLILISSLNNGFIFLSIVLIISSSISTYYYGSIIRLISFDILNNKKIINNYNENNNNNIIVNKIKDNVISNIISYIISVLTLIILLINIQYPSLIKGTYLVLLYNGI